MNVRLTIASIAIFVTSGAIANQEIHDDAEEMGCRIYVSATVKHPRKNDSWTVGKSFYEWGVTSDDECIRLAKEKKAQTYSHEFPRRAVQGKRTLFGPKVYYKPQTVEFCLYGSVWTPLCDLEELPQ